MNRRTFQFRYSFERDVCEYFLKVTIGSTGAPTLSTGKGVTSITRTSAGLYVITLQDTSNSLMGVTNTFLSSGAPASPMFNVVSEAVNTTGVITVQYRAIDNSTATDPASGEVLLLKIAVRNAST